MEVHAACGLFTDRSVERYLRCAHHIFAPAGTSDVQLLRLAEFAHEASQFSDAQNVRHRAAPGRDAGGRDMSPSEHGAGTFGRRDPCGLTADETGASVNEVRSLEEQQFAVIHPAPRMDFAGGG